MPTSRSLSVGMTGYIPDTGSLFIDIDHDAHMVSGNGEREKQFMMISGMISSAYEGFVWEQFTGLPSVSTMALLYEAIEEETELEIVTKDNYNEKKADLKLSASTRTSIEKELAAGKVVIIPQEQTEILDWQGSGYIVLEPGTMAGAYKIEGGLNGGSCGEEVALAFLVNLIIAAADVYQIVGMAASALSLFAMGPAGIAAGIVLMIFAAAMLTATIAFYCENYALMDAYLNGDEAAGEELKWNLVSSVLLSFLFWGVGKAVGYGVKKLAAQTLAEKAPKIAERLIRIFDDPGDAYRWYNSMKKANFADDLIADMADMLGRDARSKLGNLAAKGMSSELLEMLARNADLLEKFSLTDLLAFKNAASKADDIVRLLSKRGRGFVNLYRAYGDDAVTVALKLGDGALDDLQKYGLELIGLVRTKGDDFARLYQKYGSEFVAKCLRYGDDVFVNAAKYGDDYIELLMRYGDDVMEGLRLHGDDFMEQYRKRGDEFIDDFLKRGDEALKGGSPGTIRPNTETIKSIQAAIKKNGLSEESFLNFMRKSSGELTPSEAKIMENIRKSVPVPNKDTPLQKVIDPQYISSYLDGSFVKFNEGKIKGCMTTVADVGELNTPKALFEGLRLDYPGTPFSPGDSSVTVIRFITDDVDNLIVPFGDAMPNPAGGKVSEMLPPFTGNGFTSALNGQIIPEFYSEGLSLKNGAQMIEITNGGKEILKAIYDGDLMRFISID